MSPAEACRWHRTIIIFRISSPSEYATTTSSTSSTISTRSTCILSNHALCLPSSRKMMAQNRIAPPPLPTSRLLCKHCLQRGLHQNSRLRRAEQRGVHRAHRRQAALALLARDHPLKEGRERPPTLCKKAAAERGKKLVLQQGRGKGGEGRAGREAKGEDGGVQGEG